MEFSLVCSYFLIYWVLLAGGPERYSKLIRSEHSHVGGQFSVANPLGMILDNRRKAENLEEIHGDQTGDPASYFPTLTTIIINLLSEIEMLAYLLFASGYVNTSQLAIQNYRGDVSSSSVRSGQASRCYLAPKPLDVLRLPCRLTCTVRPFRHHPY